jgi:hypothetical protein
MLNCGNQKPPHLLEEYFDGNTIKAVDVLNEMMKLNDKNKAEKYLKKEGLTNNQIEELFKITYCDDIIDQFYITSEDMIGKAGVWGHFGSWDFRKALMWQKTVKMARDEAINYLMDNFNMTEEAADKTHSEITSNKADRWVSPWPGYHTGLNNCDSISNNKIKCTTGIQGGTVGMIIDLNSMNVTIEGKEITPNSVVYPTKEEIIEKKLEGSHTGFSVVLIPNGNNWQFMMTDPLQAASIFTKLFFYEGHGMKCFEKFDDVRQITGGRIITWKVDFDCNQENNIFMVEEVEKPEEEIDNQSVEEEADNNLPEEIDINLENTTEEETNESESNSTI